MASYLRLTALCLVVVHLGHGQIIDTNSTNFHNLLWLRKYHLNRYHSYLFDYWKSIDFEKLFKNLQQDTSFNSSMTEDEMLENLEHDNENDGVIAKVASLCGRLRNASSPFISDQCFKDLDFLACNLFDFIRTVRSLAKGECSDIGSPEEVNDCNEKLKKKLMSHMWSIHLLDSFGKLPSGLNMGHQMTLGRYSDCNSIIVERGESYNYRPFEANYCRATFRMTLPETTAEVTRQCHGQSSLINGNNLTCKPSENFARMKWGICAPMSCNTRNMTVLFRYMIFPTKHFCNVTVVCQTKSEMVKDPAFMTVMMLFACFLALALCGTIYDTFIYQPAIVDLSEERYTLVKDEKPEFETNGTVNNNSIVVNSGKSRREYYNELNWSLKVLLAFSVYTNGRRILDTEDNSKEFNIVHGIRALNTVWSIFILAHIYIITYIDNAKAIPKFVASFWYQPIINGSFVSDTYLMLAGFLLCYWFLRRVHNTKEALSGKYWSIYYAKRFLRFYPSYFILLLILLFVWKYAIRGPLWTAYFFNICSPLMCEKSIWTNWLMLNNFLHLKKPCLPITQLLTLDLQLHLFAPPLLICMLKLPKVSVVLNGLLILCSCLLQVALTLTFDLPPSLTGNADVYSLDKPLSRYYNMSFIKPYTRWTAFIVGLMLAQAVVKKPKFLTGFVKKHATLIWLVAVATCGLVIFGLSGFAKNKTISAVELVTYAGLSRLVWTLSVAAILYLCFSDMGGVAGWFLSQPLWAPISRLSYSAFLVAPFTILYGYATSRATLHMTSLNMWYYAIGGTIVTLLIAFTFHLLFEAPFLNFRRIWTESGSREYHVVRNPGIERPTKKGRDQLSMDEVDCSKFHEQQLKSHHHPTLFKKEPGSYLENVNESSTAKLQQPSNNEFV